MRLSLRVLLVVTSPALAIGDNQGFTAVATEQLKIQTMVSPWLNYTTLKENSDVKVTDRDIEKGYTDLSPGTVISVSTNSTSGYIISIYCEESDFFSSVEATVEHRIYAISPGGEVDIYHAYKGSTSDNIKIEYRFILPSSTVAGEYPWPIVVTIHPL